MSLSRLLTSAALAAVLMCGARPADASLIGDTVTAEILFGGFPSGQGPSNAVVGAGVEFNFGNADIDVAATGARYFNILTGGVVQPETYLLTDLDWLGPPGSISGVSLVSFQGLSVAPVLSFGPDSVSVTLAAGTNITTGNEIIIAINQDVPEPASVALLGLGLLGLAAARRHKTT